MKYKLLFFCILLFTCNWQVNSDDSLLLVESFEQIDQQGGLGQLSEPQITELVKRTDSYFKQSPEKKKKPLGKYLLARKDHLQAFLIIKKNLEKCNSPGERNLSHRIIENSSSFQQFDFKCYNYTEKFEKIKDFSEIIAQINDSIEQAELFQDVKKQSLINLAKTFANINYSYSVGSKTSADALASDLCKPIKSGRSTLYECDKESKNIISKTIASEIANLSKVKSKQYSTSETMADINKKIDTLNQSVKLVNQNVKTIKKRFLFDKPKYESNFQDEYQKYFNQYLNLANSGAGILMMTDHIKKKAGAVLSKEDVDNDSGNFQLPSHKKIKQADISAALSEVNKSIRSQLKKVDTDYSSSQLKSQIKYNPMAFSQVLLSKPQYSTMACQLISEINQDDQSKETLDQVVVWGGAILGVGLMATGFGTAAGAWLLANSPLGAAAVTAGTYITVAGVATGLTEAGYWGSRTYQHNREMQNLQTSFLAKTGDKFNIEDTQRANKKFDEAKIQAATAFGFSAADGASFLKIVQLGNKMGHRTSASRNLERVAESKIVNNFGRLVQKIASNPRLAALFSKIRAVLGPKFAHLMAELSKLSELSRNAILRTLGQIPVQRIKNSESLNMALADSINNLIKKGVVSKDEMQELVTNLNGRSITRLNLNYEPQHQQYYVSVQPPSQKLKPNQNLIEALRNVSLTPAQRFSIISTPQFSGLFTQLNPSEQTIVAKMIKDFQNKGINNVDIKTKVQQKLKSCR